LRLVPHRLAVRAYGLDVERRDALRRGLGQQRGDDLGIDRGDLVAGQGGTVQFVVGGCIQRQQFGVEGIAEGLGGGGQDAQILTVKRHQHAVGAVE
jgi:hypothetical protein